MRALLVRYVVAVSLLASSLAAAQSPVIEISGANFRPLPLALPAPQTQGEGFHSQAAEFDAALSFDLAAAGIFQVLDRKSFTADAKEGVTAASINFSRWQDVGAEELVKTQLSLDGDQLHGELRLFSVGAAREDLKVGKSMPMKDARKLAHFLADALYKHFTHEPPPFQTHIAFSRKTSKGKDVYLADWDGKNAVGVGTGGINLLPTVTPDGNGVAFTSYRSGKPDLYVAHPGSAPTPLVSVGQMVTGVTFSPDGKRIAYSLAQGESAQIYVANADGSSAHAITNTPFFINSSPSWGPDSKRLAFVSNRGGSPQIYVMSADGSGVQRLTFQGNYNQTPDWSPRGDVIAFTARDERNAFDLFVVNVQTSKISRLTQDQGNNEEPSFSPNGRLILFTSTRKGGSQLFVMTADGNTQMPLPAERGDYSTPSWGR